MTLVGTRVWHTADEVHIDVRGLDPPAPMVQILRMIDEGEIDTVLIAHLDREPIFLYPELDDRGWDHEVIQQSREAATGLDQVELRMTRTSR